MAFFDTQNPGIGGLKELTNAEAVFLTTFAGLPYSNGEYLQIVGGVLDWAPPTGGSGTVTSVSVVTANGVSASITNPTTTPALTFTLGALTPTSVVASGSVTGSNLSGTNTGDQTSIVGITGTFSQFNTAVTDADLARTDAANTFTGIQTFSTPIATASVATMSATVGGGVPTPPNNTTTFLRGDGTFATPAGSGDMVLASAQTNSGAKTFLNATMGLRNVANTFTSFFSNTATAARTWTLKDADGTLAFTTDITGTNSGTNTGDNAVNTLYSGLVSNATHTGDATGATALTVVKINGVSMAGLATGILKNTTTTGVPSIAVNSDLPAMSATVGGAVPTPPNNTTTFLRGDGTFAAPTAAAANQNPNLLVQAADYSLLTMYGMVVPYYYEIGDTFTLDIALDSVMDII